jgi:hypothetical protein
MITQSQRSLAFFAAATTLLMIPLIGMQFSKEVNRAGSNFVIGCVLLFGTAFICEMVLRNVKTLKSRIITCLVILAVLVLVWAELEVGVFGSPIAGS